MPDEERPASPVPQPDIDVPNPPWRKNIADLIAARAEVELPLTADGFE